MDVCMACDTKVDDGLTKCPQCGAKLSRPGSFLQVLGWVTTGGSLIPLVLGIVVVEQGYYFPLAVGIVVCLAGIVMVAIGRTKLNLSPTTAKPLPVLEVNAPLPVPPDRLKGN